MTSLGTYWRTVRHLKLEQIVGRLKLRLLRPTTPPSGPLARRRAAAPWQPSARRAQSFIPPMTFVFLNEAHDIDQCGWDDPATSKLWRYNLHYFDALGAHDASHHEAALSALLHRWVRDNPPTRGTGWEPYPVSLRVVNCLKWVQVGGQLDAPVLASLVQQVRWLRRRLEYHLLGNHLFVNAKALLFAGLFFEGDEAREWLAVGAKILARELPEQVLADGGHFERSPMYHALALEDVLDLLNVLSTYRSSLPTPVAMLEPALRDSAARMLRWLALMLHPDGTMALFNDSAEDIAPSWDELRHYAHRLGLQEPSLSGDGVVDFPQSGYMRVARGPVVAFLDLAPIGPDYLPGHAHADTLSFELSLHGQRLIVNGGTSRYGDGPERLKERSTAWHSTVEVDGRNSSEVWAGFRVGRRARILSRGWNNDGATWSVRGEHDGYSFLAGHPLHRRAWRFEDQALVVEDVVSNPALPAVARFILSPGTTVVNAGDGTWRLERDGARIATVAAEQGVLRTEAAHHTTRFGNRSRSTALVVDLHSGKATTRWTWQEDAHSLSH